MKGYTLLVTDIPPIIPLWQLDTLSEKMHLLCQCCPYPSSHREPSGIYSWEDISCN